MPRVLLSGYYGFGNLGDEAILQAAVQALRAACEGVEVGVLSAAPTSTAAAYGVRAFDRRKLTGIFAAVRWADLVLSGGGGLIQDATSRNSPLYYLAILRLAQVLGRKTMVLAQGLGPLTVPRNIRALKAVFRRTEAVTLRDEASAEWLRAIGHTTPEPQVTGDLAFLLRPAADSAAASLRRAVAADGPIIGLAVRPWHEAAEGFPDRLAALARSAARELGARVALLPFHPGLDLPLCESIHDRAPAETAIVPPAVRPDEALAWVGEMDVLIAMRLHALIFAASMGTPFLAVSYDPKIDAFAEAMGEAPAARADDLDAERVLERLRDLWPRRRQVGAALALRADDVGERAAKAIDVAVSLLR
jgi:polysaccharide pyruvyl transferase CsaB